MPRYETSTHFWQIERHGAANTVTAGKLANKGRTSTKHHPSVAAAQAHHDELVREQLRRGFRLVEAAAAVVAGAAAVPERAELEDRLDEDPRDRETYVVLGDLLQREGDPRGELIALQLAEQDVGLFVARHAESLLGKLARHVPDVRVIDKPPFVWRNGFIQRVELAGKQLPILDELLAHPSGRFVTELAITTDRAGGEQLVALLARHGIASLRELEVTVRGPFMPASLWPYFEKLERLSIACQELEVGDLFLPNLRRGAFLVLRPNFEEIEKVARAPWPSLERLELRLSTTRMSSDGPTFEDVAPLLRRSDLARLVHLRLHNAAFAGAILRELATRSPLAAQLEVLDLSHGEMNPGDAATLAAGAGRFAKLRELWLPMRHLRDQDRAAIANVAAHVIDDKRAPLDRLEEQVGRM